MYIRKFLHKLQFVLISSICTVPREIDNSFNSTDLSKNNLLIAFVLAAPSQFLIIQNL